MSTSPDPIRRAFAPASTVPVRVTADGFVVAGHEIEVLHGRVVKTALVRKLFEEAVLICDSPDGIRARNGTKCDLCRHPRCRPQLRIWLADGSLRYLIDLPTTSAQNYFSVEDDAQAQCIPIDDWQLKLTVLNRGQWGEVRFERV